MRILLPTNVWCGCEQKREAIENPQAYDRVDPYQRAYANERIILKLNFRL
jgi:hypothetical protein